MSKDDPPILPRERKARRREFFRIWLPAVVILAVGFYVASLFVKPAPPGKIIIATGPKTGAYHAFAQEYAEHFANNGIELEIRETAGSIENYKLLADDSSNVTLAIVQGGTVPSPKPANVNAIASLYLEPVWIFHRGREPFTRMEQLGGRHIAVGPEGSGTRAIAMQLLGESGIADGGAIDPNTNMATRLVPLSGQEAVSALKQGSIDAAFFVISPKSSLVQQLIAEPDVHLMSLDLADAYTRRFDFLTTVTLPEGVLDMKANLPSRDITLLAPAANLVAREDVHGAVVPLLIQAAQEAHTSGGLLMKRGSFPNLEQVEFEVNGNARHYFEHGVSFLYRVLPFWAASMIDRLKIFLLPLLTLLFPMFRVAPPLYRWRVRRKIYRWYRVLCVVDDVLLNEPDAKQIAASLARLKSVEQETNRTTVPLAYMEELYHLRLHIQLIRTQLEAHRGKLNHPESMKNPGDPEKETG